MSFHTFAFNNFAFKLSTLSQNFFKKCLDFGTAVDEEVEKEMTEIYTTQKAYLELIRRDTPSPPLIEYQGRCGEVETTTYEEPIKELIIETESKESTPEYESVPVRDLINTYEQGKSLLLICVFDFCFCFRNYFWQFELFQRAKRKQKS